MSNNNSDIRIGILTRPHGVAGGLRCRLDHPGTPEIDTPTLGRVGYSPSFLTECELVECDPMGQGEMVCFFAGRTTREAVEELVDMALFLPREAVHYANRYETPELIGFEVIDSEEGNLGRIVGLLRTAGHPVWEIRRDDHEWMLPAVEEFVLAIEPETGIVRVALIPGLYEPPAEGSDEEDGADRSEELDG